MTSGSAVALSIYGFPLKRFTETNKWRDLWFRKLSCRAKNLWLYLCDNCDNAGVIELDIEAATFCIGEPIEENHLRELESRLQRLPNGKFYIPKFVPFQFGELKPTSIIHRSIIKLLESHAIPISDPISHVNPMPMGFQSHQDKEKDKVQEKEGGECERGKRFQKPSLEQVKLAMAKGGAPEAEAQRFLNHYEANGWRVGKNPMKSAEHAIGNWIMNWKERNYENPGRTRAQGANRNAGTYNENRNANYDLRVVKPSREVPNAQRSGPDANVAGG